MSYNNTLYPDVCYTFLSHYTNAMLAHMVIIVNLAKVHRVTSNFSNLTHDANYAITKCP
uniref:Uncharacterized protein n=1 Tax=Cajanus cajan TaxID=3821 RepID=A0A151SSK0_CAJCA|nr:hypothetical protein KK1_004076 [Cajanus cajan]